MVIVRSPLRITLGGGGTDLPSYYRNYGGFLISAAIDKYIYVTVTRPFTTGIYLKYSKLEHVQTVEEIQHPIIRESIAAIGITNPQLEITTLADIPAGTGLGSSGSFTTGLLKALYAHRHQFIHPSDLAKLACDIEIVKLEQPIGKQDQYIAAFGGITCFDFNRDDTVSARPLAISNETLWDLEDNLLLFFTGYSRSANMILEDQHKRSLDSDSDMLSNLHYVKQLGLQSEELLESGKTIEFGKLLHEHWMHKKRRSAGMSNPQIDEWYELGMVNGAIGGKLIGAGGGGFLMFYANNRNALRKTMTNAGLDEVRFKFDFEGTKVLLC